MSSARRVVLSVLLLAGHLVAAEATVEVKRKPADPAWKPYPVRTLADLGDLGPARPAVDAWGGRQDRRLQATGWFHTEQEGRRWTLVDPEGHPLLSLGVCSVRIQTTPTSQTAFASTFTSHAAWATTTAELLASAGFTTLGSWSQGEHFTAATPTLSWTPILGVMAAFGRKLALSRMGDGHEAFNQDVLPVFHPEWPTFCASHIQAQATALAKERRVLGWFSDNELPFRPDILDACLALGPADPGHLRAVAWLAERKVEATAVTAADRAAFLEVYADAYFQPIAAALHVHAPHHLYLGCRFHGKDVSQKPLFRAAGRHLDVISFNWYHQWAPDLQIPARWVAWSGKPYLVTEWYARAMDSGLDNTTGAGWTVKTQADRAAFYQTFTLGLLADPGCVGYHWFRYQDNDPADTVSDPSNRNSNKGLVDVRYRPWTPLLDAARAINTDVHRLRDRLCPAQ